MPLRKQDNLEVSFRRALEELAKKDIEQQCRLAGADYKLTSSGEALISLSLMNEVYQIRYPQGEVICRDDSRPVNLMKKAILLRYLNNAKEVGGEEVSSAKRAGSTKRAGDEKAGAKETGDVEEAGSAKGTGSEKVSTEEKLIGFNQLPEGSFYNPAFSQRVTKPFIAFFGEEPEKLKWAAERLGGVEIPFGDVGVRVPFLPKVSISFVIWKGNNEFPPNGKILFNSNITSYLSTEKIVVASEMLFNRLKSITIKGD